MVNRDWCLVWPSIGAPVHASRFTHHASRTPEFVHFGREDKITLRQPVDFVRPDRQLHLPPREINVRMMILPLRQLTDLVGEGERLAKILELEFPFQVM